MTIRQNVKKGLLGALLTGVLLIGGGCMPLLDERPLAIPSDLEFEQVPAAPDHDTERAIEEEVLLYYPQQGSLKLKPYRRIIRAKSRQEVPKTVLEALLAGPVSGEDGVVWPEIDVPEEMSGMIEIARGVACVDLPARLRMLSAQEILAVRMAVAATLCELPQIRYANVLIGGREEGVDLGASMPAGTFSRRVETDTAAVFQRMEEKRLSRQEHAGFITLYVPSADGNLLVPEIRQVTYAESSAIECLYTVLDALGTMSGDSLCAKEVPAVMDYIEEMPEIVRGAEHADLVADIRLSTSIDAALAGRGLTRGIYMGMLVKTLMNTVPGIDGVTIRIGGETLSGIEAVMTPDEREIRFENGVAVGADFSGYLGEAVTLYTPEEGGSMLCETQIVLPAEKSGDLRSRLAALFESGRIPGNLGEEDIRAIGQDETGIYADLSAKAFDTLNALDGEKARQAVYAMVNTLTQTDEQARVVLYFEGEQKTPDDPAIELRGALMRNPGMVVSERGSMGIL